MRMHGLGTSRVSLAISLPAVLVAAQLLGCSDPPTSHDGSLDDGRSGFDGSSESSSDAPAKDGVTADGRTANLDGGPRVGDQHIDAPLGDGPALDADPPDVTSLVWPRVAFASNSAGNYELFWMSTSGTDSRRLTFSSAADLQPAVFPDGKRIVFFSTRRSGVSFWILDLGTGTLAALYTGSVAGSFPSVAPDGQRVAFESRAGAVQADVYTVPVTGGDPTRLTTNAARDVGPVYAPDGGIYFISNRTGQFEIWRMNSDGSAQEQLTTGSLVLGRPAVAPDGKWLAFARSAAEGGSELARLDLASKQVSSLSLSKSSEPAISPDGLKLAFTAQDTSNPRIALIDVGEPGSRVVLTSQEGVNGTPVFVPEPR